MTLHPKQEAILKAIEENPEITVRKLQKVCGISSPSVVQHHLMALQAKGFIKKVNKWKILKNVRKTNDHRLLKANAGDNLCKARR